jgi:hypothetical protein
MNGTQFMNVLVEVKVGKSTCIIPPNKKKIFVEKKVP